VDGFDDWYQAHYRRVFASILLLTRDRAVAQDAVDEAFTRALEQWPRVGRMASPAGWTWIVARNLVRAAHKRRTREARAFALSPAEPALPDLTIEVWDAIGRLSPRAQELVALRYVANLREPEIASTLGLAPGTVARGLHDARARLHQMLADHAEERT
jgi:RNA polymerase sigma-70 factor (ECF subfamily)